MYMPQDTYMCLFYTLNKLAREEEKRRKTSPSTSCCFTNTNTQFTAFRFVLRKGKHRRNPSNLTIRTFLPLFVRFVLSCSVFRFPWPMRAMRHHWLLLGACGWVLLILMFVSKFITFRAVDGETSPRRLPQ